MHFFTNTHHWDDRMREVIREALQMAQTLGRLVAYRFMVSHAIPSDTAYLLVLL